MFAIEAGNRRRIEQARIEWPLFLPPCAAVLDADLSVFTNVGG